MKGKNEGSSKIVVRKAQLEVLRKGARESGSTVDSLVERIIGDYLNWDMMASKTGFVQMHKTILKSLLETVDEQTLKRQAEELANETKAIGLLISGASDTETILEVFKRMITRSGFSAVSYHDNTFSFRHDMGINCSLFYGTLFAKLVNDLGGRSKIDYSKNVLSVQLL